MIRRSKSERRKIPLALTAVILSMLACNIYGLPEATEAPPPADAGGTAPDTSPVDPTPEPTAAPDVDYQGIQFSYEDGLTGYVNMEVVPAIGPGETAEWAYMPEYVKFTFGDYTLPDTFHEARLMVIPVEAYKAANPMVVNNIDALAAILAARPAGPGEDLPFLPLWNAGALIQSNAAFLDFQNGSGIRYLTQHGQAYWPINNHDLFYTFQGLTSDGRFYVSAILPVSHPLLQATGDDIPGGDFQAFGDTFLEYIADIKTLLLEQPNSSFVPDLSLLDALFQSFNIQ